jgi:hypothetical protein
MKSVNFVMTQGAAAVEGYEPLNLVAFHRTASSDPFEQVRLHDVLQRMNPEAAVRMLCELAPAMKDGATLRVSVPDFAYLARAYVEGERSINYQSAVFGMGADDAHATIYDRDSLTALLRECGFWRVRAWKSGHGRPESPAALCLECEPKPASVPELTAGLVLSSGRLLFADFADSIINTVQQTGLPWLRGQGADWGQTMERALELMMGRYDVLITTDFDSVIRPDQVRELLRLMAEYPEQDAIAAVQCKREDGRWMMDVVGIETMTEADFAAELLPVHSAHFGLTAIRTAKLRQLPHPWFLAEPNAQGRWDKDFTPSDIHFWRVWAKAGFTAAAAVQIKIGHEEDVITWPGRRPGESLRQFVGEYRKHGCPRDAR